MNGNGVLDRFPTPSEFLAALDVEAGWPPRFKKARLESHSEDAPSRLKHSLTGGAFDAATRQACVQTALRSPDVTPFLQGRWSVLGVHRLTLTGLHEDERVRVCIFDYTGNTLVDVSLRNGAVEHVAKGAAHQHPECGMELRQAIAIARNHPELMDRAKALEAQGILRVPTDPAAPAYGHRCIEVLFTQPDDVHIERPVLFSALVDMTLQQVVSLGSCSCVEDGAAGQRPDPSLSSITTTETGGSYE